MVCPVLATAALLIRLFTWNFETPRNFKAHQDQVIIAIDCIFCALIHVIKYAYFICFLQFYQIEL